MQDEFSNLVKLTLGDRFVKSINRVVTYLSFSGLLLAAITGCGGDEVKPSLSSARIESEQCAALLKATLPTATTITAATYTDQETTIGTTKVTVPFCRVVGLATPTSDSTVGFEVWMPPLSTWNGKFQGVGSGSSAGSIATAAMLVALMDGYATMATDNGHVTDTTRPNGAAEQTWALGHPEKMIDFAYRGLHVATVAGKSVTQSFYSKAASKSYFVGCSQGGHHALMEASRYADDYDGIVAGAPAWQWANLMVAELWNSMPALKDPTAITAPKMTLLNNAVIAACDALDGVTDGVIDDPRKCTYDPAVLQCTGADSATCLTSVQVAAAKQIYGGAKYANGTTIFPPYTRGSELGWTSLYTGATPGGSGWDFFRYSAFQNPTFNNSTFNFDTDTDRALNTLVAGEPLSSVYNATANLTPFQTRGGKLIIYHGWADQQISPSSSLDYYQRVVSSVGQPVTDSFLKMFMMPGIGHCSGGPGVAKIGGSTGAAASADADHDVVRALDRWVTQGIAPASLIGTRLESAPITARTRPLCAYPKVAKYKGSGSIDDAANFSCASS
jgi:feruloyl esterase